MSLYLSLCLSLSLSLLCSVSVFLFRLYLHLSIGLVLRSHGSLDGSAHLSLNLMNKKNFINTSYKRLDQKSELMLDRTKARIVLVPYLGAVCLMVITGLGLGLEGLG